MGGVEVHRTSVKMERGSWVGGAGHGGETKDGSAGVQQYRHGKDYQRGVYPPSPPLARMLLATGATSPPQTPPPSSPTAGTAPPRPAQQQRFPHPSPPTTRCPYVPAPSPVQKPTRAGGDKYTVLI